MTAAAAMPTMPAMLDAVMGGMADPSRLLGEIIGEALAPPERLTVDQWAEAYRYIAPSASPEPGKWSNERTPHLVEVMRAFSDPSVREIVLMFSTQTGKSEAMVNMVGWTMDQRPQLAWWIAPASDVSYEFNFKRITPMVMATPRLRDQLVSAIKSRVELLGMTLYMRSASSPADLASDPVGVIFGDEVDKWLTEMKGRGGTEGSALELARRRADAFGDSAKIVWASTPTEEGMGIAELYERSDQGRYWVPCPHCERYQELRFGFGGGTSREHAEEADGRGRRGERAGGLWWEGGSGKGLEGARLAEFAEHVRQTACYRCGFCACLIENHHRTEMLRRGRWVRKGQEIDAKGVLRGEAPKTAVRGFQASHLISPFKTWGDIAYDFVVLKSGRVTRAFVNSVLGEPWADPGEVADADRVLLLARTELEEHPPYTAGTVPDHPGGPLLLTFESDVQSDVVYAAIVGWGEDEQRWLIDYDVIDCPSVAMAEPAEDETPDEAQRRRLLTADNWALVEAWATKPRPSADGTRQWHVSFGFIDARYRAGEVYRFCERMNTSGARVFTPTLGLRDRQQIEPFTVRKADQLAKWGLREPLNVVHLNPNFWKDEIFGRLTMRWPAHGAMHWPSDLTREYPAQMTAERRVIKDGRRQWLPKPGQPDNHWLDAAVHGMAGMHALGLPRLGRSTARQQGWIPAPDQSKTQRTAAGGSGVRTGSVRVRGGTS